MKINKCEHGYIKKEKKKQVLVALMFILIGIAIFVTGYLLNKHSRANVFTVLAILMVLPMAKRVVLFVVLFPYQSVPEDVYQKTMKMFSKEAIVLTDYVFTSPEKVMGLDFLVLDQGNAYGVLSGKKQDIAYVNAYLEKQIRALSPNYHVKVVATYEEFEKLYKGKIPADITDKQNEAVEQMLRSLAA